MGFLGPSTGLGREGGSFEADRRQDPAAGVVAPALAPEPSAALLGRAARLGTEQQGGIAAPIGIQAPASVAAELDGAAVWGEGRSEVHQPRAPGR